MLTCKFRKFLSVVFLTSALVIPAHAADSGSRAEDKFGILVGVLAEPYVSLYGFTAASNLFSFLRISGSYGMLPETEVSTGLLVSAKTFSGEGKLFVPGWNFSPTVAGGISRVDVTISGTGDLSQLSALGGLTSSQTAGFVAFGFDWQTSYGLTIGAEYTVPLIASGIGLPGVYLGWFF